MIQYNLINQSVSYKCSRIHGFHRSWRLEKKIKRNKQLLSWMENPVCTSPDQKIFIKPDMIHFNLRRKTKIPKAHTLCRWGLGCAVSKEYLGSDTRLHLMVRLHFRRTGSVEYLSWHYFQVRVLDITLNYLIMRLEAWNFWLCNKYLFIAITLKFTLTRSGSTW